MHRGRPNDGLEAKITYHQRQGHLTAEVAEIAEETRNRVKNKTILPLKQRHLTAAGAEEEESKGEGLQGSGGGEELGRLRNANYSISLSLDEGRG